MLGAPYFLSPPQKGTKTYKGRETKTKDPIVFANRLGVAKEVHQKTIQRVVQIDYSSGEIGWDR